ncbi:MAG: IS110 family transposase [Fimbriimonadales bacterium]
MSIVSSEVGIDVALAEVVVSIDQAKPLARPNTQEGAEQLARELPAGCVVHLESSGGYERSVVRVLREAGIDVRIHNPLTARRLAQGLGQKAKTDSIDARGLSANGHLLPAHKPKPAERQALADFSRAIDAIKETIGIYKQRHKMPEIDQAAKKAYGAVIKALEKQAKDLEKQFVERIKRSSCKDPYALAKSVPCIGPVAARVCICELPEDLATQPPRSISSYAGLAPVDRSSGKRTGPAHVARGNGRLKKGLYMAAVTAIRWEPWAKDLYARLRAKGRTHDQAIVSVMRRLLLRVTCVLKRGSPWQDEPQRA